MIILDRDGVINEDSDDFIKSPGEWQAIPGSLEAIARLKQAGHRIVVASNQSGISRGYFSLATLLAIHQKMQQELAQLGCRLDGVYFCPHLNEDNCSCRKPLPGMLLQIAIDFQVNLARETVFIGDNLRDLQAAQAADCQSVLVKTGKGRQTSSQIQKNASVPIFDNLWAFALQKMER